MVIVEYSFTIIDKIFYFILWVSHVVLVSTEFKRKLARLIGRKSIHFTRLTQDYRALGLSSYTLSFILESSEDFADS